MKLLAKILTISLLFNSTSLADPILGYDILGLAKQDIKMIKKEARPNMAIGVLEGTFGPVIPPLKDLLSTGKFRAFRAHLRDATCFRNNKCPPGTPPLSDLKLLSKRAKAFERVTKESGVKCYLSPALAHDVKNVNLVNSWFKVIRKNAPSCTPVSSAFTGINPKGILKEKHGNVTKGDIVSNDGDSLYDSNSKDYFSHGTIISFAWIHRFNLRVTGEKVFIPPVQRTAKATDDDFIQINHLMEKSPPKPNKPSFCPTIRNVTKDEIWKSNAEDYNHNDIRANKIVYLSKIKTDKFNLLNFNSITIGCLKRFDPPFNNLYRYYLGTCSGITNNELYNKVPGEWLFAKTGNQCVLGNAIRRLGSYR